jgi:hypothetical protein
MITRVTVRNFKRIKEAAIDLADHVVFAGPNNSGKTTAIQALALWRLALAKWLEKRDQAKSKATLRTGVPISRPDLTVLPLRDTRLMWSDCQVQDSANQKIRLEVLLEGETGGKKWVFGMELEHAGAEQIYCRPMREAPDKEERMAVPEEARNLKVVLLPALAGLQRSEDRSNERTVRTRISEGRAGDILRNLLLNVLERSREDWSRLTRDAAGLFQVELLPPEFLSTGEIRVEYHNGLRKPGAARNPHPKLDLAMGGSGFHQVLLLLAFLYDQGGNLLLFDEPDAHLEIIRQADVYNLLRRVALERQAQLIVCTHSEKILDQTDPANVRAFLGGSPVPLATGKEAGALRRALTRIPSADFLQARERGGVLYVGDYTDVEILRQWAVVLGHKAKAFLESPFAVYIGNAPHLARDHFYGLQGAQPGLRGVMIIDKTDVALQSGALVERMWSRREIENYLLVPSAILRFCEAELRELPLYRGGEDELFAPELRQILGPVQTLLRNRMVPAAYADPLGSDPSLAQTKAGDEVLGPFFKEFYARLQVRNPMAKENFFRLAAAMRQEEIHPEVVEVLEAISTLCP